MTGTVLILGATSAIARASASAFAARGYDVHLAGRDEAELSRQARDLRIRYEIRADYSLFDAEAVETHGAYFQAILDKTGGIEGILLAFGYLGDQEAARRPPLLERVIAANFTGAASILAHCADYLETRKRGFIIGISSVAGDRGRQSNYAYGAAKGALSLYLQGLRNRLHPAGVRVVTVKPGFVDTAMTFGMPGLFLVASPAYVGERIAAAPGGSANVLYLPWFWRYIMLIIKSIPEPLFKRLKL